LVNYLLRKYRPDYILNFADDPRVDRIGDQPAPFAQTNIIGTQVLLEGVRQIWSKNNYLSNRFIQISDYEVYGSTTQKTDYFLEESPLLPTNPHSASKAGADLLVQAFSKAYSLPAIIMRCCNNYGPYQTLDKFIPFCIANALADKSIAIGGESADSREWIYVLDHCIAVIRMMFYGKQGEIYNIGSGEEITNADLAKRILKQLGKPEDLFTVKSDKAGLEKRHALNSYKVRSNLNWSSKIQLDQGLKDTIQWYKSNSVLWENKK
jgi:dTDP-glucose 4,6-dehydratase